jgi:diguanylate cyclase (GGDEF)-like protein/PAS domain S-box-containing protein
MQFQFHPFFPPLLFSAILSGVIAGIAWNKKSIPGAFPLAINMAGLSVWAATYAIMWISTSEGAQIFWLNATYAGVIVVPLSFLAFVAQITSGAWLTKRLLLLLSIEPVLTFIFVWTNNYHHLFHSSFLFEEVNNLANLNWTRGPWFWVNVLYSYSLMAAGVVILLRHTHQATSLFRTQLATILIGALLPWVVSIFTQFWFSRSSSLDLAPIAFSISGVFFAYAIFLQGRIDILPVARNVLVENLSDGLIVLDARLRIVDINPAAERLLHIKAKEVIGENGVKFYPEWVETIHQAQNTRGEYRGELQAHTNPSRHFEVAITQLPRVRGYVLGFLMLFRDITDHWHAEDGLKRANEQLATRLNEITQLEVELRDQAIRDPLTGVYNRRFLDEALSREIEHAKIGNSPLCIIMIDLDNFKDINDLYGHKAGDIMLTGLAEQISHITREGDLTCRYGGDEFIIILPNIPPEMAYHRADQIRESFDNFTAIFKKAKLRITASLGVAVFPLHGTSADILLRAADKALYVSKANGRNRVTIFDPNSDMNTTPMTLRM